MTNPQPKWNNLHILEELANKNTPFHRLHPAAKFITVLFFIITVASYDKYAILSILPLFAFPIILFVMGEIPLKPLVKRLLYAAPFMLTIGIVNPLLDHTPVHIFGNLVVHGGWLSLTSILLRFTLSILAALLLMALSGIGEIGEALHNLRLPKAFVVQLMFLYRYISVLGEETTRTLRAYSLRTVEERGIRYKVWGSLTGRLLLRTLDRAGRIYQAMRCRGFNGELRTIRHRHFEGKDILFMLGWISFFIITRLYNLPELLGSIILGVK